ncbi:hypothetical protein DV515_00019687, partial [Chloebia gouldiae]
MDKPSLSQLLPMDNPTPSPPQHHTLPIPGLGLWQLLRCSREASVIRGQLSSSITSSRSWAQAPLPRCRIPSSVISS